MFTQYHYYQRQTGPDIDELGQTLNQYIYIKYQQYQTVPSYMDHDPGPGVAFI